MRDSLTGSMLTGVVLAAGSGMRLRPKTLHSPKPLLPVGGRPLLARTLDALAEVGVRDVVVITGYRAGDVRDFLDARRNGPRTRTISNARYEHTNNAYSLSLAKSGVP